MKENINKISKLIANSKNILIVSHLSPDEDAVGSALALKFALKNHNIDSSVFIKGYSDSEYRFLPGCYSIENKLKNYNFDLIFALDYGDVQRLAINDLLEQKKPKVITIDHHVDNGVHHIGEVKILEVSSSTSEIIYRYLKELGWSIDRNIAICILAGIIGDTECFLHSNTSRETLLAVGDLLSQGVRINKITKQILSNNGFSKNFQILGQAFNNVKKYSELDLAYLIIDNNDFENLYKFDSSGLITLINTIDDCKWSLLLTEYEKGKTKASLRSEEYNNIDVSEIASLFGGGGHKLASAFKMNKSPERVFRQVVKKAKKVLI